MQKLKPEIRMTILNRAERIFYSHGFKGTTTRQIADSAEISVSNLYLYFKNKEMIFNEVVRTFHAEFNGKLKEFMRHTDVQEIMNERADQIVTMLAAAVFANRRLFVILFDKSEGTRFEVCGEKVIALISDHIGKEIGQKMDKVLLRIISSNLFNGIIEIAKIGKTDNEIAANIGTLVAYHMNGIKSFLRTT